MVASLPWVGLKSRIREKVPLGRRTTWRIGGSARWLVEPINREELAQIWAEPPGDTPLFLLGGGSNLLIEERGFSGMAVDLSRHLNRLVQREEASSPEGVVVKAEAGARTSALAHYARRQGLSGVEFLGGIPGTLGGAMRMNAGAHGGDIASVLMDAELLDPSGTIHTRTGKQLGLGYRQSALPKGWLFLSGRFRLKPQSPESIREKMQRFNLHRRTTQPLNFASAGSTFKNPATGPAAWQLIHEAGLRGFTVGDAQVSEKHTNFLINRGRATSDEMLSLIEQVRTRVAQNSGVELQLEIAILGPDGLRNEGKPGWQT
ncbi:MAG: UDP-N-acetylmuramate dehydrogenase [Magnetococcales bacterium]|nr:UDP-N-acetylmuramate dehydrogenase [Magnetococcales bacterium]